MQGRAGQLASRGSRVLFTSFHEAGNNQKMVLSPLQKLTVLPNKRDLDKVLQVTKLEDVAVGKVDEDKRRSWRRPFSEQLCESALLDTLHESVQLARTGRRAWKRGRVDLNTTEFNISPGKMTFLREKGEESTTWQLEPDSYGEISEDQVQRSRLRPFFNPFLSPCMVDRVTKTLEDDGFVCLNPEHPDQHTIVLLETDEQGERFSVTLANDESSNGAKSCQESEEEILPKVISVKTKKKKISNITLFADKSLDLRASLTVYEEDVGNLTYQVHDLLMAAWEQRDDLGGIAIPGLATGVRVDMVKQVTSAYTWAKETEESMMEVTMKVMRMRQRSKMGISEWDKCLEIDARVQGGHLTPEALTDFVLKMKTLFQKVVTEDPL